MNVMFERGSARDALAQSSLHWDERCFCVKNRRASCAECHHLGNDFVATIACVVPSRTKRLPDAIGRAKHAAVVSHRRVVLDTILRDLLHCLWRVGLLAATSPMRWEACLLWMSHNPVSPAWRHSVCSQIVGKLGHCTAVKSWEIQLMCWSAGTPGRVSCSLLTLLWPQSASAHEHMCKCSSFVFWLDWCPIHNISSVFHWSSPIRAPADHRLDCSHFFCAQMWTDCCKMCESWHFCLLCHMWFVDRATHHLADKNRADHLNPGFVTHAHEWLLERTLFSAMRLADISSLMTKKVAQESNEASSLMMWPWCPCDTTAVSCWPLHVVRKCFVLDPQHRLWWRCWPLTSACVAWWPFTEKPRLPQWRGDQPTGLEPNLSQTSDSVLVLATFVILFANPQKACSFWCSAMGWAKQKEVTHSFCTPGKDNAHSGDTFQNGWKLLKNRFGNCLTKDQHQAAVSKMKAFWMNVRKLSSDTLRCTLDKKCCWGKLILKCLGSESATKFGIARCMLSFKLKVTKITCRVVQWFPSAAATSSPMHKLQLAAIQQTACTTTMQQNGQPNNACCQVQSSNVTWQEWMKTVSTLSFAELTKCLWIGLIPNMLQSATHCKKNVAIILLHNIGVLK